MIMIMDMYVLLTISISSYRPYLPHYFVIIHHIQMIEIGRHVVAVVVVVVAIIDIISIMERVVVACIVCVRFVTMLRPCQCHQEVFTALSSIFPQHFASTIYFNIFPNFHNLSIIAKIVNTVSSQPVVHKIVWDT